MWEFQNQEYGPLRVFKKPDPRMVYTIGVDGATGLAQDYSVAQVVTNSIPFEQVAMFRSKMPVNQVSAYVDKLGRWYNEALMVCEINYPGNSIQDALLQYYKYPRNYQAEEHLDEDPNVSCKYGFRTTENTKWLIIQEFQMMLQSGEVLVSDPITLNELNNFVFQESKRKAGASPGFNDDCVMALMIALHAARMYPVASVSQTTETTKLKTTDPDARRDWKLFKKQLMTPRRRDVGAII